MSKKKKPYRAIMLKCGYVEESMASWVILMSPVGAFSSASEAVKELALDMYARTFPEREERVKCCMATLTTTPGAKFCVSCGEKLDQGVRFDAEAFCESIFDLHTATADSYGCDDWANGRSLMWSPWFSDDFLSLEPEEVICLQGEAETTLLDALLDAMPQLKAPERTAKIESLKRNCGPTCKTDWEKIKEGK